MLIEPSRKTAVIAGAWTVLGLVPFEMWMEHNTPASTLVSNSLWILALAIFLFVPGYFLVVGRNEPFSRTWFLDKAERTRYGVIAKRMFVWFLSAGVVGAVWSLALGFLVSATGP